MGRHKKTLDLIDCARGILGNSHPMTVRQLYYQLVSGHVIENRENQYKRISRVMADARYDGAIPWGWIEDRLRRPRLVPMWSGLPDFAETCRRSYRRDVWESQSQHVEVWLEKDALSGIFEDVLAPYGVTLNVGRGFDSVTAVYNAAERFKSNPRPVTVLYFGDFDPSGVEMTRSLGARLAELGSTATIIRCTLTRDDIARYHLPPDPAKRTDSRAAAFIAEHGDVSVELDALPASVLRDRLRVEVESRMDLVSLAGVKRREETERAELVRLLAG